MTKSEMFKKAHATAKQIRDCFECYRDAFAFALRELYAGAHQSTEEKLEAMGIEAWEKGDMKRYYVSEAQFEAVFGLAIDRYKSGNICGATLNGEPISNAQAAKLVNGKKIYFDAVSREWMQKGMADFRPSFLNETLKNSLRV